MGKLSLVIIIKHIFIRFALLSYRLPNNRRSFFVGFDAVQRTFSSRVGDHRRSVTSPAVTSGALVR